MTARDVDLELDELLKQYLEGTLDADDAAATDAIVSALADATPVEVPGTAVRDRLMAELDAGALPGRFDRFAAPLAAMFDVTVEKARMFLGWIDQPARWQASAYERVELVHLPPGPSFAAADCGIVRMPAGYHFPWHGHHGEEMTLVLQGASRDSTGRVLEAGDAMVLPQGAEHDYTAGDGEELIFAVRFYGIYGVELEKK
jgi:putative transcriptional regulator